MMEKESLLCVRGLERTTRTIDSIHRKYQGNGQIIEAIYEKLKEESADLLYHLLVLFAERGIQLGDVEGVLAQRHLKQSDGKHAFINSACVFGVAYRVDLNINHEADPSTFGLQDRLRTRSY